MIAEYDECFAAGIPFDPGRGSAAPAPEHELANLGVLGLGGSTCVASPADAQTDAPTTRNQRRRLRQVATKKAERDSSVSSCRALPAQTDSTDVPSTDDDIEFPIPEWDGEYIDEAPTNYRCPQTAASEEDIPAMPCRTSVGKHRENNPFV